MITIPLLLVALSGADAFKPSGKQSRPFSKPYDQKFDDKNSPLKYLGGLGPYSSRIGNGISTDIPEGCEVDQVILLQRNGEQYPDAEIVKSHKKTISKIKESHLKQFSDELSFLNDWNYFLDNEGDAGLEIQSGPYSGNADLFTKGSEFKERYGHLWDGQSSVPLFASSNQAIVQSARAFGEGFFGYNYSKVANVNIIKSEKLAGGDAINSSCHDSKAQSHCPLFNRNGTRSEIIYPEFDVAAVRLNEKFGLQLTGGNVASLLEIASYEIAAKGTSPWLDVFTREEWLAFNYRQGLYLYCTSGGSPVGRAYGANWANATTKLLNQGPEDSGLPLVLNFGYDRDIANFLGSLGILVPLKPLSSKQVTFDTRWDINDIAPMGAQLVLERLSCRAPGLTNKTDLISSNATLPESYLNNTYGNYNLSLPLGYFSPNYTNISIAKTSKLYSNASKVKFTNRTERFPTYNITTVVTNSTNGSVLVTNTSSYYGFNLTNGTTNGKPTEKSIFVRLILNEAVIPIDFGYEGPGYSCPLNKWNKVVKKEATAINFSKVCKSEKASVPSEIDYYWNFNSTTDSNTVDFVAWQGKPVK